MTEVEGYIFDVEFTWGFQSKVAGLSKTAPSFYYPPPTTLLGAIAEVLAKENRLGEKKGKDIIVKLSEIISAVGLKPINCVPIKYEDLSKIIAVKNTSGIPYPDPKQLKSSFDAPATGKTLLASLDDRPPAIRFFLVFKKTEILVDENKILITPNVFWRIHRLGSKESIVSVLNVEECLKIDTLTDIRIETQYSFPLLPQIQLLKILEHSWGEEVYINPFNLSEYNPINNYIFSKNVIPYIIPLKKAGSQPAYNIYLNKPAVSYVYNKERVVGYDNC
ncbi:MAG: type I-A CRISPR-associated protein Cas5a [Candidatus Odinarchaeum yellowstonii]|uniref:Type I-A CRISPR-associated protein Cas5a n=1 Tax=Odinarchaeota yellowstonii (strain LCB_4) TaxID=1841599 RepID=A0AAF0IBE1_ODILC|nr:MAG: type I-A CRISPR-associated protein Cas5a [Candidatus Odinarchaeum yellowstonii]